MSASYRLWLASSFIVLATACSSVGPQRDFAAKKIKEDPIEVEAQACRARQPVHLSPKEDERFDRIVVFPDGPYKGCQLDTLSERNIETLSYDQQRAILGEEATAKLSRTTFVFANFQATVGEEKYWIATFDIARVKRVLFQTEVFAKLPKIPAAHTQFRIDMQDDSCVQLYSQLKDRLGQKGPCIRHIIYSVEAGNHVDAKETFDLVGGTKKRFMLVHKMLSLSDKAVYMLEQKHAVQQFELNLNDDETDNLVQSMIFQGTGSSRDMIYHTLDASCTSKPYDLLDQVVIRRNAYRKVALGLVSDLNAVPILPKSYLRARGLLSRRIENLEAEFVGAEAWKSIP